MRYKEYLNNVSKALDEFNEVLIEEFEKTKLHKFIMWLLTKLRIIKKEN